MATKFVDFQKVRGCLVEVGAGNQGAGNEIVVDIPAGSLVSVKAYVTTAFDGTSPTLSVSGAGGTPINGAAITSTGAVSGGDVFFETDGQLTISVGGSGSTNGAAVVEAVYTNTKISDGVFSIEG